LLNGSLTIQNSNITGNKAIHTGAAIYAARSDYSINIIQSIFMENIALDPLGALQCKSAIIFNSTSICGCLCKQFLCDCVDCCAITLSSNPQYPNTNTLNTKIIIGLTVGVVVAVVASISLVIIRRKKQQKQQKLEHQELQTKLLSAEKFD